MILDAHHHFWRYNPVDYPWIDDSMSILRNDYLPGDLEKQMTMAGISGSIAVQARQSMEETRWLLELAGENDFIKAVVGWVDLRSEALESKLEILCREPKLRGIRHVLQDEKEDDFMLQPDFIRGIGILTSFDLSYDLLLFPRHLKNASILTDMFPEQRFILDHIAKPFIRDGLMEPWREDLANLAQRPNVYCKISGLVTEADLENWSYEDFIPYLDAVFESFGTERLMLGSDWPVCLLAGSYQEVIRIGIRYLSGFNQRDQDRVFAENCLKAYRIP